MKIKAIIPVLLLLWGCTHSTPNRETSANPDLDSIQEWIRIAKNGEELSLENRKQYLVDAQNKAMNIPNDTLKLEQLSNISLAYKKLEDSLEFRKTNQLVMEMSQRANEFKLLGYSHWDLAGFLQSYGILDSTFYHYKKALSSFERLPINDESKSLKARMLYNMGRIQDSYKDYLGAEISITSALKIFDELGDDSRIHNCYNVLGVIANGLGNSENSLEYYKKASEYLPKSAAQSKLAWTNKNNIDNAFLNMGDYPKAKES